MRNQCEIFVEMQFKRRLQMKKKLITTMLVLAMTAAMITGCGSSESEANQTEETDEEVMQTEESVEEEIDEEAVKAEEEAAKLAESKEYYEKGRAALYGTEGTEINLEEAYNNFERAKELGYTDANFYLGLLCDGYSYPKQDFEAAKAYYEACEENPYAHISLAFLYEWTGSRGGQRKGKRNVSGGH